LHSLLHNIIPEHALRLLNMKKAVSEGSTKDEGCSCSNHAFPFCRQALPLLGVGETVEGEVGLGVGEGGGLGGEGGGLWGGGL